MVVFTCNNCGDSLQKPKVLKHYQTACSRNPIFLTCVDCHKDFRDDEYVAHTKCLTEMERYSDKNYVGKPNKGEAKQSAWIEAVQSVISESNARPAIKEILHKIASFENVPRKKVKFMNFMRNCAGSRTKDNVLEEVWSLLEEKQKELNNKTEKQENSTKAENINDEITKNAESNGKRKFNTSDDEKEAKVPKLENGNVKNVEDTNIVIEESLTNGNNPESDHIPKFEWKKEIVNCLNSNNNEISMKSLRKKIVESYLATVNFDKYFMKKIKKIKGLTVEDNIVKLEK